MALDLDSLSERVHREGPLPADEVWAFACESLAALAADVDAGPASLRLLGETLWLALTGERFANPAPGEPFPWTQLDAAGITPDLGALPVLLARLLADPGSSAPTAVSLGDTLNMLATLRGAVAVSPDMPSRAPGPDPSPAPGPEARLPAPMEGELWTRSLSGANRRRRQGADVWNTLILLLAGGVAGFFGGVLYEKSHGPATPLATVPTEPTPAPEIPLPPSPPVNPPAIAARMERIKARQPDVGDILKYARELRRVATVPVMDGATFPLEGQFTQLVERFEWTQPDSPHLHRTPLLFLLGYANEANASQQCADRLAQVLRQSGVTAPIYACGLGSGTGLPEIEEAGLGPYGRGVEVWVAFTLF